MKINVNFTIDVPASSLAALAELAAVDLGDLSSARSFVQAEAEQNTVSYLTDNGVKVRPVRGKAFLAEDYQSLPESEES